MAINLVIHNCKFSTFYKSDLKKISISVNIKGTAPRGGRYARDYSSQAGIEKYYHKDFLKTIATQKVAVIVDGMNIFHSIKQNVGQEYLNLDVLKLCQKFIKGNEVIFQIDLFAALFMGDSRIAQIQREFIRKNSLTDLINVHLGIFRERTIECKICNNKLVYYQEKYTDVNIALAISKYSLEESVNKIYLISADDDFKPAINAFKSVAQDKQIVKVLPPGRYNPSGGRFINLNKSIIKNSQFNDSSAALPRHTSQ